MLELATGTAVCTGAPTVERMPKKVRAIHPVLSALGPDLLGESFDLDAVVARITRSPAATVGEVLLDQQVACGIGNVYKSEVLFERKVNPFVPPVLLAESLWRQIYTTARAQMQANVAVIDAHGRARGLGQPRTTLPAAARPPAARSPTRRSADRYAVYGRAGRPCIDCGGPIAAQISGGGLPRWTWWCPICQRDGTPTAHEERA
jgi:endonuclease VIII